MQNTVTKLRSVADTQKALMREIVETLGPAEKAQVAATAATVVGAICTIAADAIEAQEAERVESVKVQVEKAEVTAEDLVRKIMAKNDALRRAGTSGNWDQLGQLIDAYVGPSEEDVTT